MMSVIILGGCEVSRRVILGQLAEVPELQVRAIPPSRDDGIGAEDADVVILDTSGDGDMHRSDGVARWTVIAAVSPKKEQNVERDRHSGLMMRTFSSEPDEMVQWVRSLLALHAAQQRAPCCQDQREHIERDTSPLHLNLHRMINQLSSLLAGLRAFGAELRAQADDPDAVRRIADEYVDPLAMTVRELGMALNRASDPSDREPPGSGEP